MAERFAAGFALAAWLAFAAHAEMPAGEIASDAAPVAAPTAVAPPAAAPAPIVPAIQRLDQAWASRAGGLAARAARTRAVADELGLGSLDPLARAILWDDQSRDGDLERARAAASLAPALPLALAALARAEWHAGLPLAAAQSALRAASALVTHLDGWLWLGGTGALLAALALASGALAFLTARALAAARLVAHDLGDAIEPSMPGIARAATLVAVVALPVALGEGLVGLALGLVAVAFVERSLGQRIAVGLAALCLFAAVHPVARVAAAHFGMLRSDPTGVASWDAEAGFLDPLDAVRLARAAGSPGRGDADPLAAAALAEWTRRSGDLARAGDYYGALVAEGGADPNVLSNAAALALARSDPQAAIELYRRAIAIEPTAELWFNLSQAHGAVIDVEQHDRALAAAQALDPIAVSELTKRLAGTRTPYVPGSPLPQARVRERLGMQLADTDAMPLRDVLAPGWLGRSGLAMLVAFGIAAALGAGFGRAVEPSSRCADCAAHLCRRCGRAPRNDARCEACHRRRFEGRGPWEHGRERARAPRSAGERVRGFASWLFPGLVRTSSRGAAFGLPVALAGAAALVFGLGHAKVLPDPGSIGGAGALLGALAAAVCCAMHLALAAIAGLVARRNPS